MLEDVAGGTNAKRAVEVFVDEFDSGHDKREFCSSLSSGVSVNKCYCFQMCCSLRLLM